MDRSHFSKIHKQNYASWRKYNTGYNNYTLIYGFMQWIIGCSEHEAIIIQTTFRYGLQI